MTADFFLNNDKLRTFFSGRRRFQIAWVFAVLLIVFAKQYPSPLGMLICAMGALLRVYASGFLRKESRLTVGGPYAYTRNPLYLGTFIMAFGAVLSVGTVFLALIMGAVFFLNYHYVIENEERKLPSVFGEPYIFYCALVPRFFPRLGRPPQAELEKINPDLHGFEFSSHLASDNKAMEAVYSFFGIIIGCSLLVWIKHQLGFSI
ncbi:MAG: isoprenylcysteine carboxylmethyltransferase family protein [Bdellovibrionales bacterium]|nr:isoprenylcysteine carboxylmethyltransferase family protein [Bdellovibrionales bacterium]